MNKARCYFCYEPISDNDFYHKHCSKKLFSTDIPPNLDFNIENIDSLAQDWVKHKMGIPGVQRKLSLTKIQDRESLLTRLTIIGYLGGEYILKPPTAEYPFMPELEDLTMHLAEIANISVAVHALIPLKNKQLAYITKRFDRNGKHKIATEDLCQLSLKSTEHKYRSSSEAVGKILYQYASIPGEAILQFFELILFSFIVGNADMHLKNFSLLTEDASNIKLSPCYDLLTTHLLIAEQTDPEELALPINGKKRNLRKKDFINFGINLKIPDKVINHTMVSMIKCLPQWEEKINSSFLSDDLKQAYKALIQNRIQRIN
jgi:serine/threonine-protein kinase HipA